MWIKKKWLLILIGCMGNLLYAQAPKLLRIIVKEGDSIHSIKIIPNADSGFRNINEVFDRVKPWVDSMQGLGYLECHAGDVLETDSNFVLELLKGKQYTYTSFDYSQVPGEYIQGSGFQRFVDNKSELNFTECREAIKKIADFLDELGYPYARVYLDSTIVQAGKLMSRLNVDHGPRIYIDTIEWDDKLKVSVALMQRILGIKPGGYFSNHIMMELQERVIAQKFIEMSAPPQVVLYKNRAAVKLFIRDRKVSSLDALLGLLPGTEANPGLKLNGTFNGHFINQLRQGESLRINFQSLQNNSQNLALDLGVPYLLQLPFSPFIHFNLYKRDSLYLDVKSEAGAEWTLGKRGSFKALAGTLSSSLLKPNLVQVKSTRALPPALDLNNNYLGASIQFKKLDQDLNPKSGLILEAAIRGFSRTIKANQAIISQRDESDTAFSYASLYQGLLKKGFAVECGLQVAKYTPIGQFTTWYSSVQSGFKYASQGLQLNELYRLGGYQLLRGFDEQSIVAKDYVIWVNELRLITGALSYLHVHSDLGAIDAYGNASYHRNLYWSLGVGIVFDTSLGLLSVSSSVGRKFPDPFDFRAVKLHVGYVSYF